MVNLKYWGKKFISKLFLLKVASKPIKFYLKYAANTNNLE